MTSTRFSKIFIFFFFVLFFHSLFSQENAKELELLQNKNYNFLEKKFWKSIQNQTTEKKYAIAYLLKAKKEKDSIEISNGFFMMIYTADWEKSKVYTDSIVNITKNNINYNQPAKAYLLRASYFGNKGNSKGALKELEKAEFCSQKSGNISQLYEIKYHIARIQTDIGDYESSINMLKVIIPYYKEKGNTRSQIISSWSLANNYNLQKKPDSALKINQKIIPLSLQTRDSVIYYKLLLSAAISLYDKNNYSSSVDSLYKIKKLYSEKNYNNSTKVLLNFYLGKNYLKQNKTDLGISLLKKVDTISTINKYFHNSIRENYTILYHFYKEKNDIKNQLLYINKLLKTDSILDNDFNYLIQKTNTKLFSNDLVLEKEKIIRSQKKRNFNTRIIIVILLCICIFLLFMLLKKYKKGTEDIFNKKKTEIFKIDNTTTKRILDGLSKIEQGNLLLKKDVNLSVLAKVLETNTSYISKTINEHKQKTFKQYLIDYRIRTLIKELDEKPIMRKYSIEAMASSIGYSNASSFTRIFKNYTGKSPSVFLKKRYS